MSATLRRSWRDVRRRPGEDEEWRASPIELFFDLVFVLVVTQLSGVLYEHLTCPKEFRLFTKADGAEGHCEGMASTVFWDAAYNWLDDLLAG